MEEATFVRGLVLRAGQVARPSATQQALGNGLAVLSAELVPCVDVLLDSLSPQHGSYACCLCTPGKHSLESGGGG